MDFKILNIGVDAIGPKTDFTIEKYLKRGSPSGHQVVTRWSPSGHQVLTRWVLGGQQVVVKTWIFNYFLYVLGSQMILKHSNKNAIHGKAWCTFEFPPPSLP